MFLMDNIKIEYQPKSNEKYIPFLHCISSFEGPFYKNLQDSHQVFHFFLFLLAFTPAGIIFGKFLELHSIICEKKYFVTNFSLVTD